MSEELHEEEAQTLAPLPASLEEVVASYIAGGGVSRGVPELHTTPDQLVPLLTSLRDEVFPPYNRLTDLFGIDDGEGFTIVYSLFSGYTDQQLLVKVSLPRETASVPTVTSLCPVANWPERELAEMFGIDVEDHPRLEPLLLYEGFAGYPLRKDFEIDRSHPYLAPDPLREDPGSVLSASGNGTPAQEEPPAP
jgi:NADH-quinone oxidoreductase subunit C